MSTYAYRFYIELYNSVSKCSQLSKATPLTNEKSR